MQHILLYVLMFLFSFQCAFCQVKKPVQKPVYKQAPKPVFNVKDDPSPVKFIQLKKDTPVYTPQSFYIQKVVDNTNSDDSIGFILQPQSGKKQRVSFANGTVKGLEEFFNFKVVKDTTLYPLVVTLKSISLSEEKENDYRNGIFRYAYSFDYIYNGKTISIESAEGRFNYKTHITQNRYLDSNIAKTFTYDIAEVERNMLEAKESHSAFCKGVNTSVTYTTANSYLGDTLFFDNQQELMWDDFTAEQTEADDYFMLNMGLLFDPEVKFEKGKFQVKINTGAYFLKPLSWAGKKARSPQLLTHVQYRFKIAGLESLKLKKKIEATTFSCANYENEIRDLIVTANKQMQNTMDLFNKQTLTGSNKKEQKRWQDLIDDQLSEFKITK
jgi:hypothetical protein